jgi:hypothetical protein
MMKMKHLNLQNSAKFCNWTRADSSRIGPCLKSSVLSHNFRVIQLSPPFLDDPFPRG